MERYNENSFIFDKMQNNGVCIVSYPTKEYPYWGFFLKFPDDDTYYELDMPRERKNEIKGQIISMKLDNYWVDPTDWTNIRCS